MSRPISSLLLIAAASLASACYSVTHGAAGYERHGVWLPHTGQQEYRPETRITVQGHELRFDEALRVYRVVEIPGYFYSASRFYRRSGTTWETSRSIDGSWSPLSRTSVPPTLVGLPVES